MRPTAMTELSLLGYAANANLEGTMRLGLFAVGVAVLGLGCGGGGPTTDDAGMTDAGGLDGALANPCRGMTDGTACGAMHICVSDACVLSRCGDGVTSTGEDCDDGNTMPFD